MGRPGLYRRPATGSPDRRSADRAAASKGAKVSDSLPARPSLCVSLPPGSVRSLALLRGMVTASADLVEVRLDLLEDPEHLETLVGGWSVPVVATCRREQDGGLFHGPEEQRLRALQRAACAGASLVDLEDHAAAAMEMPGWPGRTRFLVSRHRGAGMFHRPLDRLYRDLAAFRPAMVKLVPTAKSLDDGFGFLEELTALTSELGPSDPPVSAFCMGDAGIFTRILALSRGASMVYASFAADAPVAPGQVSLDQLTDLYRVREIGPRTCFTGIVGQQVSRSLSPMIHNHLYRILGLNRCYLPLPAQTDEVPGLLDRFREGNLPFDLGGLSVTAPLKMAVIPHLDHLSPIAGRVGAVNTLVRRPSGLVRGLNTDLHGILGTLRAAGGGSFKGKRGLIIGAGGAARAAAMALRLLGMNLTVANRTPERAEKLAREMGGEGGAIHMFSDQRFDLVVNASGALLTLPLLDPKTTLFDLNYHPSLTPLLAEGRRRGCCTRDGLEMLARQGEQQFRLFTGIKPPSGAMIKVARDVGGIEGGDGNG